MNPDIPTAPYIQTRYGSWDTAPRAMQIAAATAMVSQNRAEMTDRRLEGLRQYIHKTYDKYGGLLLGSLGKG